MALREGIQFPALPDGSRPSSEAGKAAIAAAIAAAGDKESAAACAEEKKWRFLYGKHFAKHVETALESKESAVASAEAGLDWLHANFVFYRPDSDSCVSLAEALVKYDDGGKSFFKGEITGSLHSTSTKADFELNVPYKGEGLVKERLERQLQKWEEFGTIEPSAAEAIREVSEKGPEWCDLRNKVFVVLGALSAMGPYEQLMDLGATIVALDLDRPGIWERLISRARNSRGKLIFPLKRPQNECKSDEELFANAGCDLIAKAPEVAAWVNTIEPSKQLTVGCYVYLDGEMHVRVALACDMVMQALVKTRRANVAFLCTPTDMHVIPKEARDAAVENYSLANPRNWPLLPVRLLSGRKMLKFNASPPIKSKSGETYYTVDGLVVPQGPNYALAKRIQHWRAIVSREKDHVIVSSNIAPSTATRSVISNRQFAWAYDGMPYFQPYEIFSQETSNAVMTALLIYDISDKNSAGNPNTQLSNPYELMSFTGFHGGVWRSGYTVGSIGEISVLIHFIKVLRPFLVLGAIAAAIYKFLL